MNTIKTLALATIIIGMASCASTQRSQMEGAFGKSTTSNPQLSPSTCLLRVHVLSLLNYQIN